MRRMRVMAAAVLASTFAACPATKSEELVKDNTAAPADSGKPASGNEEDPMTMKLTSSVFNDGAEIPTKYTCEGEDLSPPLSFAGVPAGVRSLALIVDDPDAPDPKAPKMTWVHWVLYNLPPTTAGLPEAVSALPPGTLEGKNDWKKTGYGGPCPPIGRHRYFFKLYALDAVLPDLKAPTKAELEKALQPHILSKVELIGTYQKKSR